MNNKKSVNKPEIKELFNKYSKTKDRALRDELIEKNLYIAEILAKKFMNKGIEYDDLFQVASLGLVLAIDRFDVSKGFEFSSFATPTIVGEIKRYFRDKGWVIRVPRRIKDLSKKVNDAKVHLSQNFQKTPTISDIAKYLNISEESVLEALEAGKVYTPQSLEASFENQGDDKDLNLADLLGEEDKSFTDFENRDLIERTVVNFSETEKKILYERFFEKRTQMELAKELNISQMTVSRIEKKILQKFRDNLKDLI